MNATDLIAACAHPACATGSFNPETAALAALRGLVNEPQPLGIYRPAYQATLAVLVAADEATPC